MSPHLIDDHHKLLQAPPAPSDAAFRHLTALPSVTDSDGDIYSVELLDDGGAMADVYVRSCTTGDMAANLLLTFDLRFPADYPGRVPQVKSVFVDEDYRLQKISLAVYKRLTEHYGALASDTDQTLGGMLLWAMGLARDATLLITVMSVTGNTATPRQLNGVTQCYQGNHNDLLAAGAGIWDTTPGHLLNVDLTRLGFRPAGHFAEELILSARKQT